ncbi:MAG TPA: LysR substrate-binding domain-containing protein, partial [Rhodocyclaceae bacterium]|nr:LysR substrate-binding domain-containing protein [Rhodocyclaceae bacterium]
VAPSTITAAILPRLESFEASMPDIELELHQHVLQAPENLTVPDADVVFSWGEGDWAGWESENISPNSHLVPLCLPQMLNNGRLFTTEEIAEHTWIVAIPFDEGWKRWYAGLGVPMPRPNRIIRVSN